MKRAILGLLILLTACAGERRTIGKDGMAQRDYRPAKDRHGVGKARPRTIAFDRPAPPEPQVADAATSSLTPPAHHPSKTQVRKADTPALEAAEDRMDDRLLMQSPAIRDPQPVQEELPERTRWDPWAPISALVFVGGLAWAISLQSTELLIVFGAIAFAIALISARRCRDKGLRGQGIALVTMYLAGVTFLVGVLSFLGRFR